MYCVMRASVPSLYNVYRRYDRHKVAYQIWQVSLVKFTGLK